MSDDQDSAALDIDAMALLSEEVKARVSASTVAIEHVDNEGGHVTAGQAVHVAGGFVLTAAHCIDWQGTGAMALEPEAFHVWARTSGGARFRLTPLAIDPLSDLAVLGEPDDQAFFEDAEAFREWSSDVGLGVRREFRRGESIPVFAATHRGGWTSARATRNKYAQPSGRILCSYAAPVESGTSGGPIVDKAGELVGVVSMSNESERGPWDGLMPLACRALPRWVWFKIRQAQKRAEHGGAS